MVCIESVKYCAKRAADACASFDLTPNLTETPSKIEGFIDSSRIKYDEHCERAAKQGFKALTYGGFLDISVYIWNNQ